MQDSSLEKQLQQLMSGLEFEPDAAVWNNIEEEINPKKKKRIAAWWWLTGGILLLCLSGGILWHGYNTRKSAQPVATQHYTTQPAAALPQQAQVPAAALPQYGQAPAAAQGAASAQTFAEAQASARADVAASQAHASDATVVAAGAADSVNANGATTSGHAKKTDSHRQQSIAGKRQPVMDQAVTGTDMPAHLQAAGAALPVVTAAQIPAAAPTPALSAAPVTVNSASGTLLPAMDMNVVLYEQEATLATDKNAFTPAAAVTPLVIVPQKQKSRWNAYPLVAIGAAANIGGVNTTHGYGGSLSYGLADMVVPADRTDYQSYYPGTGVGQYPGSGSGSLTSYLNMRNTYARLAFRLGMEVEYAAASHWRILTGLQYQYISYKSVITTQTLTSFNSNVSGTNKVIYDFAYRLQYMAIPLQVQYRFSNKLATSAGIMNNIKLSGRQGNESINNAMRTWVPSALLSLDILLPGRKEQVWKLSPYVQYGLKSNITGALQDKRMLQAGVQAVWQIPND